MPDIESLIPVGYLFQKEIRKGILAGMPMLKPVESKSSIKIMHTT